MKKLLLLFLTTIFCFSSSHSGQDNVSDEMKLEEKKKVVLVKARRKIEDVQEIPMTVVALDSDEISKNKLDTGEDLATYIPGFKFVEAVGSGSDMAVRGLIVPAIGASTTSGAQTAINGHVINNTVWGGIGFLDPSGVEILEGPQGTLYGRNTTTGLINLTSARPGEGNYIKLNYGEKGYFTFKGAYDVDILENLSARIALATHRRDGSVKNTYTNNNIDSRNNFGGRLSIDWGINSNQELRLTAGHYRTHDSRLNIGASHCERDSFFGCSPFTLGTINTPYMVSGTITNLWDQLALFSPDDHYANTPQLNSIDKVYKDSDSTRTMDFEMIQLEHILETDMNITTKTKYTFTDRIYFHKDDNDHSHASTPITSVIPGTSFSIENLELQCFDPMTNTSQALTIECSDVHTNTHQFEGNIISNFSGKHNFTIGGYYYTSDTDNQYSIQTTAYSLGRSFANHPLSSFFNNEFDNFGGQTFYTHIATMLSNPLQYSAFGLPYATQAEIVGALLNPGTKTTAITAMKNIIDALNTDGSMTKSMPVASGGSMNHQMTVQKSRAIFGEYYFDITDITKLTLGLRYMDDTFYSKSLVGLLDRAYTSNLSNYADGFNESATKTSDRDQYFMYKTALQQFYPNGMVYASFSTGKRPGGANPDGSKYKVESTSSFELGSKNTLMDGKLLLNGTLFRHEADEAQYSTIRFASSYVEPQDFTNTGLSADIQYQLTKSTFLNLGFIAIDSKLKGSNNVTDPANPLGFTTVLSTHTATELATGQIPGIADGATLLAQCNAVYNNLCNLSQFALTDKGLLANPYGDVVPLPLGTAVIPNLKDNRAPGVSNLDINIGITHLFKLKSGIIEGNLGYVIKGNYYSDIWNNERYKVPKQYYLNLNISYKPFKSAWGINVWAKNIEDKRNITSIQRSSNLQGGANFATYGQGRSVGLEFEYQF